LRSQKTLLETGHHLCKIVIMYNTKLKNIKDGKLFITCKVVKLLVVPIFIKCATDLRTGKVEAVD